MIIVKCSACKRDTSTIDSVSSRNLTVDGEFVTPHNDECSVLLAADVAFV
jgi:endonuclease V-like protein UPF0215 family